MATQVVLPRSLPEFARAFPDEDACRAVLTTLRWPDGFRCPRCGGRQAWERRDRGLLLCRSCRAEASLLAGTVLHRSRLPLRTWLLAAFLVATTSGVNSIELGRALGIADQETNWLVLRRLRTAMSGALGAPLRSPVEADETFLGAPEPRRRGRPSAGSRKVTVLVLAEAGSARTRMRVVPDARAASLLPVVAAHVEPGATVATDGLTSYLGLPSLGFAHRRLPHPPGGMRAGSPHSTPHADAAMSNYKRWVLGTYNKPPADPQPYLDEFCFRAEFSGRRDAAFGALLTTVMSDQASGGGTALRQGPARRSARSGSSLSEHAAATR